MTISNVEIIIDGTAQISADVYGEVTYEVDYPEYATVDGKGLVTGRTIGATYITIKAKETDNYEAAEEKMLIYVVSAEHPISRTQITLSQDTYVYAGERDSKPEVSVTDGAVPLVEDIDYAVSYSNNRYPGTASVTITGKRNYTGTTTKTFTIEKGIQEIKGYDEMTVAVGSGKKLYCSAKGTCTFQSSDTNIATVDSSGYVTGVKAGTTTIIINAAETDLYNAATKEVAVTVVRTDIDISSCAISLGKTSYTYDGITAYEPEVTVTDGDVTLVEDTDFVLNYKNNKNAGTASVTISGIGNYTGSVTKTFTIKKAEQKITGQNTMSVTEGSKAEFDCQAEGTLTFKSSNTGIAAVDSSGNVTGVKKGTATITIKAAATDNYNAATKEVKVTVVRTNVDISLCEITLDKTSYTYDGTAKCPPLTITYKGDTLVKGTDYKCTYNDPYGPGTVSVTIYGLKSYKGSITKTYTIYTATPVISSVSNTSSGVTVKWSSVKNAKRYRVFRAVSGGTYYSLGTTSSTSFVDKTAKSGTTYYYKVRCMNQDKTKYISSSSASKSNRYLSAGKISSLTNTSKGITVKWSKVTGASGYYIYRRKGSGSYVLIKTIRSGSTISYSDTAVKSKNATSYTYAVRPYYGSTKGSYVSKTQVRLTTPSLSSVTKTSSTRRTVKWKKVSSVSGYQIQYCRSSSFSSGYKTITVSGSSTVSKKISGLTSGKTYYFRLRTYKKVSGKTYYSGWSSIVKK